MNTEGKALQIDTLVPGLSVSIGADGVWLNFSAGTKHACVNMNNTAEEKGKIIGAAITEWCKQTVSHYKRGIPITAETYTSDDMNQIIVLFADHIATNYNLHSKQLNVRLDISPEAMVAVWKREMEHAVVEQ